MTTIPDFKKLQGTINKHMNDILIAQEKISMPKIFVSSNVHPSRFPGSIEFIPVSMEPSYPYSSLLGKYIDPNTGEPIED